MKDALIRSAASVIVGALGYWIPLFSVLYYERLARGADLDDRIGFYFLWTLPIIIVYAILATIGLCRAYWSSTSAGRWVSLVLVLVLASLCWSPLICLGVGIVQNR